MTQISDTTAENAPENAIDIQHVNKTYAARGKSPAKEALKDVILGIPKGSMFALLGPNGAGKSTLINIMAGLVNKTSGSVKIWDKDIDDDPISYRHHIGIVGQEIAFDPFFSPKQVLEIQAGLYGIPKSERRTAELLDLVGLTDKADAWARQLSGGMKRRLMVAKAMVHNPDILILDEPTAGVDIELRQQLWENVRALNKRGTTILLTTHYLEEAENLCDRIAIINHGQIIACDEKEALLSRIDGKELQIRLDREITAIPDSLAALGARQVSPRRIAFLYTPNETPAGAYIEAIQKEGLGISDILSKQSDLEDVFLQLTRAS